MKKHHQINKDSALNDVILTVSLIMSMVISMIIIDFTDFWHHKYNFLAFCICGFILTKIFYNLSLKFFRKYKNSIEEDYNGIRE